MKKSLAFTLEFDLHSQGHISLAISINQLIVQTWGYHGKMQNAVIGFDTDLDLERINTLTLHFDGESQPHKELCLHRFTINNQDLKVASGFYVPDFDSWWQSLDSSELSQYQQLARQHGGHFGWYGRIYYDFCDQSPQSRFINDVWGMNRIQA